ncbi:MAG: SH3 domain-containing protein [Clostridia bacterium]|nr:SH3 domain-containing protein [Clostridia bacterium]
MKRFLAFLTLLVLLTGCAQAETFTLNRGEDEYDWMDMNLYYVVETFSGAAPEVLRPALDASPFVADEILQGALLRTYYFKYDGKQDVLNDQAALLAVRHEERTVLLGAARIGGEWVVRMQSETFLRDGEDFRITAMPNKTKKAFNVFLTVVYGDEQYFIASGSPDQPWMLKSYRHQYEDGTAETVSYEYGLIAYQRTRTDAPAEQVSFHCVLPAYLETADADQLPHSRQALEQWAQAHPIELAADEAYMGGANLRKEPTGSSRSHGQYLTPVRVKVLGQAPGQDFPWYNVRVGNTEGWVSGAYFYTKETDTTNLCMAVNHMQPVARLRKSAQLLSSPGGEAIAALPAETEMHVLVISGSWAQVVLPRGELGWHADWEGTFGYVPLSSLTMAASPLQLRQTAD